MRLKSGSALKNRGDNSNDYSVYCVHGRTMDKKGCKIKARYEKSCNKTTAKGTVIKAKSVLNKTTAAARSGCKFNVAA